MTFLEKDLEQIIFEADKTLLSHNGLDINGRLLRQLRIGNYGVADLIEVTRNEFPWGERYLTITVHELKKDKIGIAAFLQALNYCKGIKTYLEDYRNYNDFELRISLVGKEVDNSGAFIFLTDLIFAEDHNIGGIAGVDFYTYKYEYDGIKFKKEQEYNLTNTGFKKKLKHIHSLP